MMEDSRQFNKSVPVAGEGGQSPVRVDFAICGTQKGGTTALDSFLREHPGICMANRKEVHFFDNEAVYATGSPDYSLYHAFFAPPTPGVLLGEATPMYMYWQDSPRRMWEYNPAMKLIILLRNPVTRAFSHYCMELGRGFESWPFWDAVINEPQRSGEVQGRQHRVYSYLDRGFYLKQLERIWTYFPREQVLVLRQEDLREHYRETLDRICAFLGLDPMPMVRDRDVVSPPPPAVLSPREREFLRALYRDEIARIEKTFGWDCSQWLNE